MKQTALFPGNRFGNFFHFFKKKTQKEILPISVEDLKNQVTSPEYEQKLKILLKEDLLTRYEKGTVEKVVDDLSFLIYEEIPIEENFEEEEEQELKIDEQEINIEEPEINFLLDGEKKNEVDKIENRIPKWFRNPHQINTRILVAYMELLGDDKSVPLYKLETSCRSIKTFQSNYNQMKIISEKNHGKIFEESGSRITLWEPTRNFVKKEYEKYLTRLNN